MNPAWCKRRAVQVPPTQSTHHKLVCSALFFFCLSYPSQNASLWTPKTYRHGGAQTGVPLGRCSQGLSGFVLLPVPVHAQKRARPAQDVSPAFAQPCAGSSGRFSTRARAGQSPQEVAGRWGAGMEPLWGHTRCPQQQEGVARALWGTCEGTGLSPLQINRPGGSGRWLLAGGVSCLLRGCA